MANSKAKILINQGVVYQVVGGERRSITDFAEALALLAKCCGIDCCKGEINGLIDRTTKEKVRVFVDNGVVGVESRDSAK